MFEKVKRFTKKIATSKKTQMTCLMMVCGVTALMAQTTAGDYSAGTAALTQVSEEIAKYELNEDFSVETAIEFGRLYRSGGQWKFEAMGIGYKGGLQFFVNKYA